MENKYAKYIKTGVIIGVALFILAMGLVAYGISVGTTAATDSNFSNDDKTVEIK